MQRHHVTALLVLSGFPPDCPCHELVNQYDRNPDSPWWLVITEYGPIKIGWRKRVIHIEWADTPLCEVVTEDDVTKHEGMVHAWNYSKAVEYLTSVARLLEGTKKATATEGGE